MIAKMVKVPTALVSCDAAQATLELEGCSVVQQCVHSTGASGTMYLEEHLLLFVLGGTNKMTYGKQTYVVRKNEMILLKKATAVQYEKAGDPDNDNIYESMMFSLKDDLLKSFLSTAQIEMPALRAEGEIKSEVYPINEYLVAFVHSLKPYFNNQSGMNPGQLRLKMMELLYDVAEYNKNVFYQILQLHQPVRTDVSQVVEQHYASPVNLEELAYLSGRSLSSFKRDFQRIYNMSPASWIREKRLVKAKEMLEHTQMSVTDICFSLGFENVSHFSRIFKAHHGQTPSSYREVMPAS